VIEVGAAMTGLGVHSTFVSSPVGLVVGWSVGEWAAVVHMLGQQSPCFILLGVLLIEGH